MLSSTSRQSFKNAVRARARHYSLPNGGFQPPTTTSSALFHTFAQNIKVTSTLNLDQRESTSTHNPFFQQVRWKRKDGNRFHMQERPPTKKQRKRHNRMLKEARLEREKHGKPGSKAGARREWARQWKEDIMNPPPEMSVEELEKYTIEDALLDDLIGNTSDAQPTPEPVYLGHKHKKFFNLVADQMEDYRNKMKLLASGTTSTDPAMTGKELWDLQNAQLPSDRDLSLALRAYRDREGTRKKPVGIIKALKHLLQDVGVPVTTFGEMTYTTLLTCAQTPAEGRRIMQMMKQQGHPISSYSWSILVDIHSKVGDYKGCLEVHREMIAHGLKPTLPSFTSLLAACYKVCNDGRVSHKLRVEAGETAWEQWQEMRIVGVDPDVMAYGAILRIMAARGKPERALNILEEMQVNQIAPTTLCFTSALRAVARSHAIAIRYEQGWTRRNLRREYITMHHGKLAQAIVRLAESAEVEQDDGFIAALISCAATAGDLATAKAVYVANQIRRLDQFRTIGSNEHLARLRGEGGEDIFDQIEEGNQEMISDGSAVPHPHAEKHNQLAKKNIKKRNYKSFGEREYGKDSRILSAVMLACANAAGKNMVGSMWQGRENEGYLCENSLRLLNTRPIPSYTDSSIPGATRTDNLTWAGDEKDLDYRGKKRMSGKFTGVYEDDTTPMTFDELDEPLSQYFADEEGRRLPEYQKVTAKDIWNERYGSKSGINEAYGPDRIESSQEATMAITDGASESRVAPMHFNLDTMRWESGPPKLEFQPKKAPEVAQEKIQNASPEEQEELYFDTDTMRWKTRPKGQAGGENSKTPNSKPKVTPEVPKTEEKEVLYFDENEMRWKTKESSEASSNSVEAAPQQKTSQTTTIQVTDDDFNLFFEELKQEVRESGGDLRDVNEEEARELFDALREEYSHDIEEESPDDEAFAKMLSGEDTDSLDIGTRAPKGVTSSLAQPASKSSTTTTLDFDEFMSAETDDDPVSDEAIDRLTEEIHSKASLQDSSPFFEESVEFVDEEDDPELVELRALLPAFSDRRLRKIQKTFAKNLGDPSILDLVKISREIMPDYVTNTWLKQMSALTARYVMKQAIRDGLLDVHMLNGVLQLETSLGRLDRAMEFHQTEFTKHGIQPTAYSDRLVLQMFLENNRFSRALAFKALVEKDGRTLDLHSYGGLIDYCARRGQVGSAMLLLKECQRQHGGSQPGNAHLAQLRIVYRRAPDLDEKYLEDLIGPDPIRWLKHGEAHLKREMSKKGRRDVRIAENARLRL